MDWFHLGHATWLAETSGLRLLFDPLIESLHHGGVFEVVPPRTVELDALRADFLFVSHRHPDHFDIPSLRALARVDPDTVVVTPDALVESTARTLGFRKIERVATGTHVSLDGVGFVTTPSHDDGEWGVMVGCDRSVVWNQVDTGHPSADAVRETVSRSLASLEEDRVSLALVRWQPLLEVEAMISDRIGFPHREYARTLEQIAAIDAAAIVPASAGAQHAPPFDAMNRLVYPVTESRFLRDLSALLPDARTFPGTVGARFHVEGGETTCDPRGGAHLVRFAPASPDPRRFRPFEIEAVWDPNLDRRDVSSMRAIAERFVRETLAPALVRPISSLHMLEPVRLVLEVVLPNGVDAYTFAIEKGEVRVERRFEDDYDALVSVAASMLCDVIEGIRHWGDPLLAGLLRSSSRAYRVDRQGARSAPIAAFFPYYAISYEESVTRAVEHALREETRRDRALR